MLLALLLSVADAGTVTQTMETTTSDGIVVGTATKTPVFAAAVTFTLLDPETRKPKSSATVSTAFTEFPNWATLREPVVRDGGKHLFSGWVGFRTDGMGAKQHHVFFAIVGGRMTKVLDVYSEPWPPSGDRDKQELVMLRALKSSTKGLPDIGETRKVTLDKKVSLVRKLWRFDGQRYSARNVGEPRVAFVEGESEHEANEDTDVWVGPSQAVDGLPETAWISQSDTAAITVNLKAPVKLAALKLTAACTARPKKLRVRWDAEEEGPELEVADVDTEQMLKLPAHKAGSKLTLEVLETHGDGGVGACISELSLEALAPGKR